jgi:hypothetical protein
VCRRGLSRLKPCDCAVTHTKALARSLLGVFALCSIISKQEHWCTCRSLFGTLICPHDEFIMSPMQQPITPSQRKHPNIKRHGAETQTSLRYPAGWYKALILWLFVLVSAAGMRALVLLVFVGGSLPVRF